MITGKETILSDALKAKIIEKIQAAYGPGYPIAEFEKLYILTDSIAEILIPFLVDNVQVNSTTVPGTGLLDGSAQPVTGIANTDPGDIS